MADRELQDFATSTGCLCYRYSNGRIAAARSTLARELHAAGLSVVAQARPVLRTLQDKYVAALRLYGGNEVPARTRRYRVLTRPQLDGTYWFVGNSGAIRIGKKATGSIPAADRFKAALLEALDSYPDVDENRFRVEVARIAQRLKEQGA